MFDLPTNDSSQMKKLMGRVNREKKFCLKVQKMVRDIENKKSNMSLADCWRWLKGLLHDFVQLKSKNERL